MPEFEGVSETLSPGGPRGRGEAERALAPPTAAADRGASAAGDPIRALVDKEQRGEALTPNEQVLIDLLR